MHDNAFTGTVPTQVLRFGAPYITANCYDGLTYLRSTFCINLTANAEAGAFYQLVPTWNTSIDPCNSGDSRIVCSLSNPNHIW